MNEADEIERVRAYFDDNEDTSPEVTILLDDKQEQRLESLLNALENTN